MQEFNRANLQMIRKDIDDALRTVASKHGIALSIGNMRFQNDSFSTKLNATIVTASSAAVSGPTETYEALQYKHQSYRFGLPADGLGKKFYGSGGKLFVITGLKPLNHKYPVLGKSTTGRAFKFTADQVKRGLASYNAAAGI